MSDPTRTPSNRFFVPVIVIVLGSAWLLTSLKVLPQIDWVFVLLLALFGILMLIIRPLSRGRLVAGATMLSIAIGEVLQDLAMISRTVEIPALVILGGLYALIAQCLPLAESNDDTSNEDDATAS